MQNAPQDTETIGINYRYDRWNVGFFNKRVGRMYNDNGSIHSAVAIDPFNITNLFINFTLRNASAFSQSRVRFGVNNLFYQKPAIGQSAYPVDPIGRFFYIGVKTDLDFGDVGLFLVTSGKTCGGSTNPRGSPPKIPVERPPAGSASSIPPCFAVDWN